MSADNYNLIRHCRDGKFRVWLNLAESCDQEQQVRESKPDAEFDGYDAALDWTEHNTGYVEYGTVFDQEREPGKCICAARMEGECCCGAWKEASSRPTAREEALLARVRELEEGLAEMCDLAERGVRNQDSFGESWVEKRLARIAALRSLLAKERVE